MSFDPALPRCQWPGKTGENTLMVAYHDAEWGVPVHDDRKHFEYLVLDAFQAGLGWSTALKKRGFRFTGSTIRYACMQAAGLVNDHVTGCFQHAQIRNM